MMDTKHDDGMAVMMPEVESALRSLRPSVPPGFARRAVMRFEAALAKRRFRRMIAAGVGLFVTASSLVWLTLLNVGRCRDAVVDGVLAAVTLIKSVFTLWSHLAGFGIVVAVSGMLFILTLAGVVSKLDHRVLAVK